MFYDIDCFDEIEPLSLSMKYFGGQITHSVDLFCWGFFYHKILKQFNVISTPVFT